VIVPLITSWTWKVYLIIRSSDTISRPWSVTAGLRSVYASRLTGVPMNTVSELPTSSQGLVGVAQEHAQLGGTPTPMSKNPLATPINQPRIVTSAIRSVAWACSLLS
jgi:hypothetical protein